ncbi:MAG TPA: SprB repeat-containing protein, partial [Bacteroidales bacterium]|nr:SprB repeat-containing protein [Bacteroidales bacterium]
MKTIFQHITSIPDRRRLYNVIVISSLFLFLAGKVEAQLSAEITAQTDVDCFGNSTGSATVTATGGLPPYSFLWNDPSAQITEQATGLAAGDYTVMVTDANLDVVYAYVTITQPTAISITGSVTSNYNGSDVSCYGSSDGEITATAIGGTGILTYVLDQDPANVTGSSTGIFTGISAGMFTVTVTDENGCTKTTTNITISNPPVINALAGVTSNFNGSQISCNGSEDAAITVVASGGTGVLSYILIEDPANTTGASTGIFTGVGPGTYTIRVTDVNLCENITAPVTVTEPAVITIAADVTSDYNGNDISCNGASDGEITATGSGGTGTMSYMIEQLPGNVTGASSGIFTGMPAGTYTVRVTDSNGCTAITNIIEITQPSALSLSETNVDVLCYGGSTGSINLSVSGGTSPYTYLWSNTATTQDITGLPAGTYSVTVTDANSCTSVLNNIQITQPASALTGSASVTTAILCNGGTATVTLIGSGGTAPLSYTFNGTTNSTGIFTGIIAGTAYPWSITDANSCGPVTGTLNVTQPSALTGSASVTTAILCNGGT